MGWRTYRPQPLLDFPLWALNCPTTDSRANTTNSASMMAVIVQPSRIPAPNKPIMRYPDRHQRAALVDSALFRARDRASTDHLGSPGYAHLPRKKQSQFDTRAWLSPILAVE